MLGGMPIDDIHSNATHLSEQMPKIGIDFRVADDETAAVIHHYAGTAVLWYSFRSMDSYSDGGTISECYLCVFLYPVSRVDVRFLGVGKLCYLLNEPS